jgi:hypothetical protein
MKYHFQAISSDSLSSTIVYNNCTNHQTSSYVPRNHNGDVIGASISFLPYGKIFDTIDKQTTTTTPPKKTCINDNKFTIIINLQLFQC